MERETTGTIVSVTKLWWIKINTTPVRTRRRQKGKSPYLIKVSYTVDGKEYTKRVLFGAEVPEPHVGDPQPVVYNTENPKEARFL